MIASYFVSPPARRRALAELLARGQPIVVPGAYDALSARLVEQAGFPVALMSGFGFAASALGLPDMGLYTRHDNVTAVRNAVMSTSIPVMADIDDGYGAALNVMRTVREFELAGASTITLEDQIFPKRCPLLGDQQDLLPLDEAVGKIKAAVAARTDPAMLIVARTDALASEEVMARAAAYAQAGADLIKPISGAIQSVEFLQALHQACGKPLSVSMLGWLARQSGVLDQLHGVVGVATHPLLLVTTAARALQSNLAALQQGITTGLPYAPMSLEAFGVVVDTPTLLALERQYAG